MNSDVKHWEALYNCLANRLVEGLKMRGFLAIRKAEDRLLHWLHWRDSLSNEKIYLEKRLGSIGLEINLTKESIYRAFTRLKARGLVEVNKGVITLSRSEIH